MSTIRNTRLVVKICELYYFQEKSQKEISAQLGISRPQVSRIIAHAKEAGLVTVHINNPYSEEASLEKELIDRFDLKDALIINTSGLSNQEERLNKFAIEAATYFDSHVVNGIRLGVMSGKTISTLVDNLPPTIKHMSEIVPLIGGIGTEQLDLHANSCVQRLAAIYKGTAFSLNSPAIMSSIEAAEIIRKEPNILSVLEKGKTCDMALVGIGTVGESSTTAKTGGLSKEDLKDLAEQKAQASICSTFLNDEGKPTCKELGKKSIGHQLEDLGRARS